MSVEPRKFDFDEVKVEEKLVDFRRVVMEDDQSEISEEMTKFLAMNIDIYYNTLRSFVMLAVSLWQTAEKKLLKDMKNQTPEIRYQTVETICDYFKGLLTGLLRNKGQSQDLEKAVNGALKLYKETWAGR